MPLRKSDAATRTSDDHRPADGAAGTKQVLTLAEMAGTEEVAAPAAAAAAVAAAAAAADPQTREATPDELVPSSPISPSAITAGAAAAATAGGGGDGGKERDNKDKEGGGRRESRGEAAGIEDFALPRSVLTRLAKGVLPANTQIQGTAVQAMTKSATVFISHLANAANTLTTNAGKKTIMPADVLAALDDIEFGFMRPQLEEEFAKFNHIRTSKRSDYRKRIAAAKKATGEPGEPAGDDDHDADVSALDDASSAALAAPGAGTGANGSAKAAAGATTTTTTTAAARDAQPPLAKKAKRAHGGAATDEEDEEEDEGVDESHIDVDGEEEEEEEEDDEEEEEEEEDDDDDDADVDPLEAERADGLDEDEALDSDGSE